MGWLLAITFVGLVAGFVLRTWWTVLVAPTLVIAFAVLLTEFQTDIRRYGEGEFGRVGTALLTAMWPFVGAIVGVLSAKILRR